MIFFPEFLHVQSFVLSVEVPVRLKLLPIVISFLKCHTHTLLQWSSIDAHKTLCMYVKYLYTVVELF